MAEAPVECGFCEGEGCDWCWHLTEDDPFKPGTRVEVHELEGGYLVIPTGEPREP